jgi:hypothetical protein
MGLLLILIRTLQTLLQAASVRGDCESRFPTHSDSRRERPTYIVWPLLRWFSGFT